MATYEYLIFPKASGGSFRTSIEQEYPQHARAHIYALYPDAYQIVPLGSSVSKAAPQTAASNDNDDWATEQFGVAGDAVGGDNILYILALSPVLMPFYEFAWDAASLLAGYHDALRLTAGLLVAAFLGLATLTFFVAAPAPIAGVVGAVIYGRWAFDFGVDFGWSVFAGGCGAAIGFILFHRLAQTAQRSSGVDEE